MPKKKKEDEEPYTPSGQSDFYHERVTRTTPHRTAKKPRNYNYDTNDYEEEWRSLVEKGKHILKSEAYSHKDSVISSHPLPKISQSIDSPHAFEPMANLNDKEKFSEEQTDTNSSTVPPSGCAIIANIPNYMANHTNTDRLESGMGGAASFDRDSLCDGEVKDESSDGGSIEEEEYDDDSAATNKTVPSSHRLRNGSIEEEEYDDDSTATNKTVPSAHRLRNNHIQSPILLLQRQKLSETKALTVLLGGRSTGANDPVYLANHTNADRVESNMAKVVSYDCRGNDNDGDGYLSNEDEYVFTPISARPPTRFPRPSMTEPAMDSFEAMQSTGANDPDYVARHADTERLDSNVGKVASFESNRWDFDGYPSDEDEIDDRNGGGRGDEDSAATSKPVSSAHRLHNPASSNSAANLNNVNTGLVDSDNEDHTEGQRRAHFSSVLAQLPTSNVFSARKCRPVPRTPVSKKRGHSVAKSGLFSDEDLDKLRTGRKRLRHVKPFEKTPIESPFNPVFEKEWKSKVNQMNNNREQASLKEAHKLSMEASVPKYVHTKNDHPYEICQITQEPEIESGPTSIRLIESNDDSKTGDESIMDGDKGYLGGVSDDSGSEEEENGVFVSDKENYWIRSTTD